MNNTAVKELMEEQIVTVSPDDTLAAAARKMKEANCGCLPVGAANKPEGIITDRDIVIRAIAENLDPADEKVRDYMTCAVKTCKSGDTLEQAAGKMREHGVSRLVVTDEDDHAVGILTFGRILRNHDDQEEVSTIVASAVGRSAFFPMDGQNQGPDSRLSS